MNPFFKALKHLDVNRMSFIPGPPCHVLSSLIVFVREGNSHLRTCRPCLGSYSGDEEWLEVVLPMESTSLGIKAGGEGLDGSPKTKWKT